jgi:hypothetical protein
MSKATWSPLVSRRVELERPPQRALVPSESPGRFLEKRAAFAAAAPAPAPALQVTAFPTAVVELLPGVPAGAEME